MSKPRVQLSVQISLFVEKDEEEAGEKKKCLNNSYFSSNQLAGKLALSNDRLVAWGIRLPIQDNVCTTGQALGLKR